MKKLMIVAAAALCATVGFGDIESNNIVGYANGSNGAGEFKLLTPQFQKVGGTGVDIQSIKLSEGATDWSDFLQIVDSESVGQDLYMYASAAESGFEADGWLSTDASALADVVLTPGQSVLLYTEADATVVDAGEVASADTVTPSVAGFNLLGNNTPEPINIQDVVLGEGATSWSDFIQFLETDAVASTDLYSYATVDESGFEADGWLTPDCSALADIDIAPGVGFLLYTENADVNITIPSAL